MKHNNTDALVALPLDLAQRIVERLEYPGPSWAENRCALAAELRALLPVSKTSDGVEASDEAQALEALPVAFLRSITHPDWLELCSKDEPGAFPVFASHADLVRSVGSAYDVPEGVNRG
jgi:hypothetical protein